MDPAPQSPAPRRHVWRWVLLGVGICLTPILLLGLAAVSYLTLDGDVRLLREQVMAASDATWSTRVQMSAGRITLGALGQCLRFVRHKDMADARLALRAVKQVSVGVYERTSDGPNDSREQFFVETDRAMQKHGWTRLVGVADRGGCVLVYVQDDLDEDEPIDICVAVVSGKEMVVASTTIDAEALGELVAKHTGDDIKGRLHFAKHIF